MIRKAPIGLVALFIVAASGAAQQVEQEATHIVRPGDTLRGLTRQYLGTELRWRENWSLNPQLEAPDVLVPGERIRILVPRADSPVPTARVVLVSGDVEERPAPVDWLGALSDDLLLERDGLRTGEGSSSAVRFGDGSQLALTEGSLVFLRRAGRTLEGVDERSVEIVEGQAELAATRSGAPAAEVEIVIGEATAKPRSGAGGELQARARKSAAGGAAVMMYEGSGEVRAAGESVEVERGMGTSVPEAGPPAKPEKLLPRPGTLRPAAAQRLPYPDPELAWSDVESAASYVVEVCVDAACLDTFLRRRDIDGTSWRAPALPVGTHHWRVTAVAASGLDGYPSVVSSFTVLTDRRDLEPPTLGFEVEGPSVKRNGELYYAADVGVRLEVRDEPAGVAQWRPIVDGESVPPSALSRAWGDGRHTVDVVATDKLGNSGNLEGPRFTVDAEPPRLIWEQGAEEAMRQILASVENSDQWARRWRAWQKRARRSSRRGQDPGLWALIAWQTDSVSAADWSFHTLRWRERRRHQSLSHAGDSPALLILAPRLTVPGGEQRAADQPLLLRAVDDGAGVRSLSVRTVAGAGGPELEVETVDRLGNRRSERALFVPGS